LIESAALGGIGSVLGGGKFANGAVTAAFSYAVTTRGASGSYSEEIDQAMTNGTPANPDEYSTVAPSEVATAESDPRVQAFENHILNSRGFNDPAISQRYEEGRVVYLSNGTGDVTDLVNLGTPKFTDPPGLYRSIRPNPIKNIIGSQPFMYIHDHPFPITPIFGISGSAFPSRADVDFAYTNNLYGVVISHGQNFYFGLGPRVVSTPAVHF
jgi:hypothetical protein